MVGFDCGDWENQVVFWPVKAIVFSHDRRGYGRSTQTWHGNSMDAFVDAPGSFSKHHNVQDAMIVAYSHGGGEVPSTQYPEEQGPHPESALLVSVFSLVNFQEILGFDVRLFQQLFISCYSFFIWKPFLLSFGPSHGKQTAMPHPPEYIQFLKSMESSKQYQILSNLANNPEASVGNALDQITDLTLSALAPSDNEDLTPGNADYILSFTLMMLVQRLEPTKHSKLVQFLCGLQKRIVTDPATDEPLTVGPTKEVLWTDLPSFGYTELEAWDECWGGI